MADASDEDEGGLSEPETKADSTAKRDARLAREAELRKMMEDDDGLSDRNHRCMMLTVTR